MRQFDYLVVGAGSAGCAVAHELAGSGRKVLVLEAGGKDSSIAIKVPMGTALADISRFDWGYVSAPDPSRDGRLENWPRGRVVGGSSSINGMNYVRGAASDFDRWAELGNDGWSSGDIMPLFRELERCDPGSIPPRDQSRGYHGCLDVRMVRDSHKVTDAFIRAAEHAGHPFSPDYNGPLQEGVGYAQLNQRLRRRWSAADAFLKPALRSGNITLITNAHVRRILVEGRRVTGAEFVHRGAVTHVSAGRIVLSSGAIGTPQILLLSGIGDPAQLERLGIGLRLRAPEVGRNLMEHPLISLIYRMKVPTYNSGIHLLRELNLGWQYLTRGEGPLACAFEAIGFLKTRPALERPDIQLHVGAFGYGARPGSKPGSPARLKMLPYPSMTILVNKNHPASRGEIVLRSKDPDEPPLIRPNLLGDKTDLETLVAGIATVRDIFSQPPLEEITDCEVFPASTEADLANYVRANAQLAYHPAGTCRMGADPLSVVDPQMRVRGLDNLWIADASIMPSLISGNTNAICMIIGLKLGRQLRGWS